MIKRSVLFGFATLVAVACTKPSDTVRENPSSEIAQLTSAAGLDKIIDFQGLQVTGVTVSDEGRLFANFPRWREGLPFSVIEIASDGSYKPYPDPAWNEWTGQPQENKFTCVQSVIARGNSLFVLDPSNPQMKGVVGKPMLYEFDLKTNALKRKWSFDPSVAPPMSYLNDLRFDETGKTAYMTESGLGALVILDLESGKARRVLDKHPSTKAEPIVLRPKEKPFVKQNGQPQRIHSDGIALKGGFLYYHALTGYQLYRVPLTLLSDPTLSGQQLASQVESLGKTPAPDGMIFDRDGNLYMADLENNAIVYRTPQGELRTLIQDPNLHWPDTFTIDRDNNLIFTDSRLDQVIPGQSAEGTTFSIYRIPLSQNQNADTDERNNR